MNSKLSRWADGLIEAGWIAAIIATPLFFNIHSDRVFEPDKLTLLRSIALLMVAAWLVKFIDQQGWRDLNWLRWRDEESVWRKPFVLPMFALSMVYLISTIFSVTPTISFLGSYQRLQGTYSTLSYIVVFAMIASTMRTRAQVSRVATAVIITSIPVAFYGLLQHFSRDPLPWGGNTVTRVAGHMGNAIFVAAYLIMAVPLTIARIIDAFTSILNDEELATADVIRSSIYIFTLAIQLITIYWTQSRGPWIGLAVSLFAFILIVLVSLRQASTKSGRFNIMDAVKAIGFVFIGGGLSYLLFSLLIGAINGRVEALAGPMSSFAAFMGAIGILVLAIFIMIAANRGWRWLWMSWLTIAFIGAAWLMAFNFTPTLQPIFNSTPIISDIINTIDSWKTISSVGRLGKLFESDSGTGRVRTLIWKGTLDLISPHDPLQYPDGSQDSFNILRPLIGYGPESMYVAYNHFYPPELATIEARNASPDRSHNETFDALVITGGLGFIIWQILYISVFYYGFRWLGVIHSKRDGYLMVGLWIIGAIIASIVMTSTMEMPFLGVAIPAGSIGGLVLYLVYYALFTRGEGDGRDPFDVDRLIMIGLVTAVLAHYAEIHFGIAIAATRVHFFAYVGLMYVLGYRLAQKVTVEEGVEAPAKARRIRRPSGSTQNTGWGVIFAYMFMLSLVVGIMGYQFTTYSLPPDKVIQSAADLTSGEIFHQSLLVNPSDNFSSSPFIFLMMTLTWALGTIVILSEMVKNGEFRFSMGEGSSKSTGRRHLAAGLFILIAVIGIGIRFLPNNAEIFSMTRLLAQSLLLVWGAVAAITAVQLYRGDKSAAGTGGVVATIGLLAALPALIAGGGLIAFALGLLSAAALYLLWEKSWSNSLLPAAVMGGGSLLIGLAYTFTHASILRGTILFQPPQGITDQLELRILEALSSTALLTMFYVFVIVLMFASAFALSSGGKSSSKNMGSTAGYVSLVVLFMLAFWGISQTNLRVIHADMVYKRAKPFDGQQQWDVAIAIYEEALNLAPNEDFYELFLGRAMLEAATAAADTPAAQESYLARAEERLIGAQDVNPLNTDHTANLARLNTRWLQLLTDPAEQQERLELAEKYYQDALKLSPQNSVIRNEYARLAYDLMRECDLALELYSNSIEIDPYYEVTYLGYADTLVACAAELEGEEKTAVYQDAISALTTGLELLPTNIRAWQQLGQIQQELGEHEDALASFEEAIARDERNQLETWRILYIMSISHRELGDDDNAINTARQSLEQAPEEYRPQIQQFLSDLTGEEVELSAPAEVTTTLDGERPLSTIPPANRINIYNEYPPMVIDPSKEYEAVITTDNGEIRLELLSEAAPLTVNSFVYLATQGYFDDITFHRVLEGFMAQGGDPSGTGSGGPGYQFPNETDSGLSFDQSGVLAMANAGQDTNGSQFFITFGPTPQLDGGYTIFGQLIDGEEVLNSITFRDPTKSPAFEGDTIQRIDIVEK